MIIGQTIIAQEEKVKIRRELKIIHGDSDGTKWKIFRYPVQMIQEATLSGGDS